MLSSSRFTSLGTLCIPIRLLKDINKAVSESVFFGFEGSAHFEGIADYLSISFAEVLAGPTIDPACWAEWWVLERRDDRRCGRRLDRELHYPEVLQESNSVHGVGQVFSGPLWTIRGALGHVKTDTLVLESLLAMFGIDPSYTLADAAEVTVETAEQLRAEGFLTNRDVREVSEAFEDRGFFDVD